MGSKAIVFLGLLLAMLLLVSSEVAATDLVEETPKATEAETDQYGRRCFHGCCRCCSSAKATEAEPDQYGRRCFRSCCRCCSYAGQPMDADFNEAPTHN